MTKNALFSIATLLLMGTTVWARGTGVSEGPGPTGIYENCSGRLNDGTEVSFQIRATAAPTFIDAVLLRTADNRLIDQLACVRGRGAPGNGPSSIWKCSEYRSDRRMGISVELTSGGVVGRTTGQIKQEQVFPHEPKLLGTLLCQ